MLRLPTIAKRQPVNLYGDKTTYHSTPETEICLNCRTKKCNGECARLKEELKKLKIQDKQQKEKT